MLFFSFPVYSGTYRYFFFLFKHSPHTSRHSLQIITLHVTMLIGCSNIIFLYRIQFSSGPVTTEFTTSILIPTATLTMPLGASSSRTLGGSWSRNIRMWLPKGSNSTCLICSMTRLSCFRNGTQFYTILYSSFSLRSIALCVKIWGHLRWSERWVNVVIEVICDLSRRYLKKTPVNESFCTSRQQAFGNNVEMKAVNQWVNVG